jgi:hypothetical protein
VFTCGVETWMVEALVVLSSRLFFEFSLAGNNAR